MGGKAAETAHNIKSTFGPGPANERTGLEEFCKRDESLEDEECSGQPSEIHKNQLRSIIIADPLTSTQEIA